MERYKRLCERSKTVRGYKSPEGGKDITDKELDILGATYASCRDDSEDKEKCSKIAWGAVNQYKKKEDTDELLEKYIPVDFSEYTEEEVEESIKWKYVVRKGKKVRKPYTDSPNKRIVYKDGKPKEVPMTSSQRNKISRRNKKSAKKAKVHKTRTAIKRKKSTRKHTW